MSEAFSNELGAFLGFLSAVLLGGAAIGAVYGWIASHVELASVRALDPSVFGDGPVLLRFDLDDLPPAAPTREAASIRGGQYRMLSNGRVLFAPRVFLPLPGLSLLNFGVFKGSIDRMEGVPHVSVRTTVGGTVLLASFGIAAIVLVLWPLVISVLNAESCTVTINGRETAGGAAWRIVAAALLTLMALLVGSAWGSFSIMRRRARRLALEVRSRIVEASAGRTSP